MNRIPQEGSGNVIGKISPAGRSWLIPAGTLYSYLFVIFVVAGRNIVQGNEGS